MTERYIRTPLSDTRLIYGDSFESDAWFDTRELKVKRVAVTYDPNLAEYNRARQAAAAVAERRNARCCAAET